MLVGVYASEELIAWPRLPFKSYSITKPALLATPLTVLSRTLIMLPLDYTVFPILLSLTTTLSLSATTALVVATMPSIMLFNITVSLYAIPTNYLISKKVVKELKLEPIKLNWK